MASILIGTASGLIDLERPVGLEGQSVAALARSGSALWAITDGRSIQRSTGGPWEEVAPIEGYTGRCILPLGGGEALVGTSNARLMRLMDGRLEPDASFDDVKGRDRWYTPWGGPPDTRSLSRDERGMVYANVHVGGIVQSDDSRTWKPSGVDIDADVHQVLAHPTREGAALAATAYGLATSEDGGDTWAFETDGLHATYCRAVAVAGDTTILSASRSHRGQQAAVYRRRGTGAFERCREGLPEWFGDNIDTYCLGAAEDLIAVGTSDGSVYLSTDEGASWEQGAAGLPAIRCIVVA